MTALSKLYTQNNNELLIKTIEFLISGRRTIAITGPMGVGKKTLALAMINILEESLTLCVNDSILTERARILYPNRSIRKLDNEVQEDSVAIIGEMKNDLDVCQLLFLLENKVHLSTIFLHHARTFPDLVNSLRNSLLRYYAYEGECKFERRVAEVLEFNIHLGRNKEGGYFVERISECVPTSGESVIDKQFEFTDIIEFKNNEYTANHPISNKRQHEIEELLEIEEKVHFKSYLSLFL